MGNLYTGMKIFRFKDKIDSLPRETGKILAPIHIRIKPTNACNHNCRYCAYRAENLQLGQDMNVADVIPRDKMLEIVEDLGEMDVKAVTFSGGGEPFCYPHLAETMRALADNGIRFASLSNGGRLQGEAAEVMAEHGTWLRVSMDGWDDESYAQYRGVKVGEFSRVMDNIAAFKKLGGKCYLGVNLIIDEQNHAHIRDFVARVKDAGADSVKVSPCIVSNDGKENNEYHRPFFETARDLIEKAASELEDDHFEIYNSYHELENDFHKDYTWCPYLQVLPIIGADQNIYSCQDKAYNKACGLLGSIRDERFKDVWFSDKNRFFTIDPSRDCTHHCVADGKNKMVLDYLNADPEHGVFV